MPNMFENVSTALQLPLTGEELQRSRIQRMLNPKSPERYLHSGNFKSSNKGSNNQHEYSNLRGTLQFNNHFGDAYRWVSPKAKSKTNTNFLRSTISIPTRELQSLTEYSYQANTSKNISEYKLSPYKAPSDKKISQSNNGKRQLKNTKTMKPSQSFSGLPSEKKEKIYTTNYEQLTQQLDSNMEVLQRLKKLKEQREERNALKEKYLGSPNNDYIKPNFSKVKKVDYLTPKPSSKMHYQLTPTKNEEARKKSRSKIISRSKPTIGDFKLGKLLGEGRFGKVYLATHKETSSIFAVKQVEKEMIKSHFMIDQFILEVKLQSYLEHQNILKIYGIIDNSTHIYLILEYMEGDSLYRELKVSKQVSEDVAKVHLKQVCSAVSYMHQENIAHRDIKPQNIVITHGVCKLCDFGWATICNERRTTYCGTFDYAAPQLLEGVEYDISVDLWCLGILAYELMVGKAPFYHFSRNETKKRILDVDNSKISYPESLSAAAKDFIDKLLKKKPEERLQSENLLNHSFIRHIHDCII